MMSPRARGAGVRTSSRAARAGVAQVRAWSWRRSLVACGALLAACGPTGGPTPPRDAPSTDASSTDAPGTDTPGTDVVAGDAAGTDASGTGTGDFTVGPTYAEAPEYAVPPGAPEGMLRAFDLPSNEGTHFTTDVATGMPFTRSVSVWIPGQYVAGSAAPFIVLQDGSDYLGDLTPALQTLIHQRRIPPVVAIAIDAGPGGAEGERSREYDTLSEEYLRFVEDDVLPRVRQRYGVALTTNPDGRAAMGGSSGGAAAFTMGWFRPDLYRRVLTYSGSFVNQQPDATYPRGAWEYHARLIAESAPRPLRVFLEAGEDDFNWNSETDVLHGWLEANRAMAAALAARGYAYRFVYAMGAEHVDNRVIRQTLPAALEWLWRGYPIP